MTTPVSTTPVPPTSAPVVRPVVVVDAGHNGGNARHVSEIARLVDAGGFSKSCNTTGTAAGDLSEAEFNWLLAGTLRDELENRGASVVMTRPDNEGWGPCIDARGQTAATNAAVVLVSIHADGEAPSESGFHVIYPSPGPSVSAETAAASADVALAVRDALIVAGFGPSTYAGRDGLAERGDLGTLNRAEVPAVMVECGNMHNAADLAHLGSEWSRQRMAEAIAGAVSNWVDRPAHASQVAQ